MSTDGSIFVNALGGMLIAFLGTVGLLPWLIRKSRSWGAVDWPGHRKLHTAITPRVGGFAIVLSFVPVGLCYLFSGAFKPQWSTQFMAILLGTLIIVGIGVIDDTRRLKALHKFLLQGLASIIVVSSGVTISSVDFAFLGTYSFSSLEVLVTIVYIVGITNAINLIDGLDGLAGGVALIITSAFLGLSLLSNHGVGFILILTALVGSLTGFLLYNRSPAKVFLGDTGSLFLGWIFAILSLVYAQKSSVALSIALPVMVLGLPAFDVIFVMVKRFLKHRQYSFMHRWLGMFEADNNHLHHLLVSYGFSRKKAVWMLYAVTAVTSVLAFSSWVMRSKTFIMYNFGMVFLLILVIRLFVESKINHKVKTEAPQLPEIPPIRILEIEEELEAPVNQ